MSAITPELLGSLLDAHGAALRLYARQFFAGGETADADDVVQVAFVQLARQATMPDDAAAWLFRVVRNGALSARRGGARRRRREELAAAGRVEWFEPRDEARIDAETAVVALRELPEEIRETVVAHLWGGLTFEQIAVATDTSSSTAHRRYEQGLRTLRERLEKSCRTMPESNRS